MENKLTFRKTNCRGFTLTELLISIGLGLFMSAGILQIFVNHKNTLRIQSDLSLLQENGRYSLNRLTQSVLHADHWASADVKNIDDTISGSITAIGSCDHAWLTDLSTGIRGYEGAATIGATSFPSNCIPSANYLAKSDILVLRYADSSRMVRTADMSTVSTGLNNNAKTVFIRTSIDAGAVMMLGSDTVPVTIPDGDGTYNFPLVTEVYYIRRCSEVDVSNNCIDTIPSLVRMRISSVAAAAPAFAEEVVATHVEQLQFQYGRDSDNDMNVDRYDQASSITSSQWSQVMNVKLGLVTRAAEADVAFSDTASYVLPGYLHIPTVNDRNFHRKQYNALVQIRNRVRQ